MRIQIAVFDRAIWYSSLAAIAGVDLLAIDDIEAELLANQALRPVGDKVQVQRPIGARLAHGIFQQQVAEAFASSFRRDGEQRSKASSPAGSMATHAATRSTASPAAG